MLITICLGIVFFTDINAPHAVFFLCFFILLCSKWRTQQVVTAVTSQLFKLESQGNAVCIAVIVYNIYHSDISQDFFFFFKSINGTFAALVKGGHPFNTARLYLTLIRFYIFDKESSRETERVVQQRCNQFEIDFVVKFASVLVHQVKNFNGKRGVYY